LFCAESSYFELLVVKGGWHPDVLGTDISVNGLLLMDKFEGTKERLGDFYYVSFVVPFLCLDSLEKGRAIFQRF
jgi:hypothetical protein